MGYGKLREEYYNAYPSSIFRKVSRMKTTARTSKGSIDMKDRFIQNLFYGPDMLFFDEG